MKALGNGQPYRFLSHFRVVWPVHQAQHMVVQGLHADGQAVNMVPLHALHPLSALFAQKGIGIQIDIVLLSNCRYSPENRSALFDEANLKV